MATVTIIGMGKCINGMSSKSVNDILEYTDSYLVKNGKVIQPRNLQDGDFVHIIPRLRGGKGGFGSMLRAIGAQIEKTTNREACRDLSGRRLRDINEEKRLKAWIEKQADRQREADELKQAKLEKLRRKPKHIFEDKTYMRQKEKQTDNLFDALEAGTSAQNEPKEAISVNKRESDELPRCSKKMKVDCSPPVKRKKHLWIDPDMPEDSDISDSDDDNVDIGVKKIVHA